MKELHIRERVNKAGKSYEYRFEVASVNGKRKFVTKGGSRIKLRPRKREKRP